MNKSIGGSFDAFLKEESLLEHSTAVAVKRSLAWQIERGSEKQDFTKPAINKKLKLGLPPKRARE